MSKGYMPSRKKKRKTDLKRDEKDEKEVATHYDKEARKNPEEKEEYESMSQDEKRHRRMLKSMKS